MIIIDSDDIAAVPGLFFPPEFEPTGLIEAINATITEAWAQPVEPVPQWVKNIGLRLLVESSKPVNLESLTRGIDDATRTERYSSRSGGWLELTADERARLAGTATTGARRGRLLRTRLGY